MGKNAAGDALTPAEVVAHYVDHSPARSKAQTRKLLASLRRLRREDDTRRAGSGRVGSGRVGSGRVGSG